MRLLFDQNLAARLVQALADLYPDSVHVRDIGLHKAGDTEVRAYADLVRFAEDPDAALLALG